MDLDGNVVSPHRRESFPDIVVLNKKETAREKRQDIRAQIEENQEREEEILNSKDIFSESESENESNAVSQIEEHDDFTQEQAIEMGKKYQFK